MTSTALSLIRNARHLLRRSAVQHVAALTIAQGLAAGMGILTTVVAARILGPEGYGQAALVFAFPSLALSVGSFKSVTVTTRYIAGLRATRNKDQLRAVCKLGYAIDFTVFLIVLAVVTSTGRLVAEYVYGAPWMFRPMVLYAASFPLLAFRGGSIATLTAFEEFRRLSLLYVLDRGMNLLSVVALLLAGYGVIGMALGMAIGNGLIGLVSLYMATALLVRNGIGPWWKGSLRSIAYLRSELFSFFGWNYLMASLNGAISQLPVMLLGAIRGVEEAGFFRLALTLITAGSYPATAAGRVVYPRLSARWGKGETIEGFRQSMKHWTLRGGLPLALSILCLIPLLPLVVPFLFGASYRLMVPGVQVLFVAAAVSAVFFWLNSYYYATGLVATWTKGFALYTALVLAVGWLSLRQWGFFGMAAAFSVGEVWFLLVMAWKSLSEIALVQGGAVTGDRRLGAGYLAALGKLAAAARSLGLGYPLSLVRDSADYIWMKRGSIPLRITVDAFILTGFYRHRSFLAHLQRSYEPFFRQLFEESLRPGMVIIDGGAHIGLYSLIASRKLGNGGKVLAFEPDHHNSRALLSNLSLNHCHNVVVLRKALSSSVGRTRFYQCAGTISSSLIKRPEFDAGSVRPIEVETTTVDRELGALDLDTVLIKLDLEGAEPLAVQGMRETIKRASSAAVFVEVNPSALYAGGYAPAALVHALQELGLELFFIDEESCNLQPVTGLSSLRKGNMLGRKRLFERQ